MKQNKCIVCGECIDWGEVCDVDLFQYIIAQANALGMESLTEHEQVVMECLCCSEECYDNLK